jgi:hypothetical protein
VPEIEGDKDREYDAGNQRGFEPQPPRGPEEIDAVQEADEQRRIAERGERAADIGHEKDEEHDDVDIVKTRRVGADERPDQDHGRAGGPDHAGNEGTEGEYRRVDDGRAGQFSRHQNATGDDVEREQEHDEA